ncbi:MAG: CpsD/CapB family tyrosine-protein kinase [Firmicutes bacterium]|nr:CpsD/CapB family tyrosine-protein kinase [Bacillota bacterium]
MFKFFSKRENTEDDRDPRQALVTIYNPRSAASEAYRMLRTNIHFSSGGDSLNVLVVTSTFPGEGKSLTAANLAITFAQAGESVVLVDADMRRSSQHEKFELPESPGLSEAIISGNIEASLRDGPVEGLKLMAAGLTPPNPSELLHSRRMDNLLDDLKARSHLIIVDAPPVLAVTDASVLASKADGVIIVMNMTMSDKNACKRAVDSLKAVNARVLGTVITGMEHDRKRYGYRDYYDGYYDGYYHDSEHSSDEQGKAHGVREVQ